MPKKTIDEQQAAWAERTLDRIEGDENRQLARRFVTTRRANNCKAGSIANYAHALRLFATHLSGRSYVSARPDDVAEFVANARSRYTSASIKAIATLLASFYRWLKGDEELPRSMRMAFRVKGGKPRDVIVTDEELASLLAACPSNRDKAMLWVLRETGFRISELASLNVDSVRFHSGGADIEIPPAPPA